MSDKPAPFSFIYFGVAVGPVDQVAGVDDEAALGASE